jgi:DNA ligase D-like protein (predicted 3'-phosphoesterase)
VSLEDYQKRRDFVKTPEPQGKISKSQPREGQFSIQEHDASHLHYDLRLEIEGVLKSWAIPKEPPKASGIKRLAVRTEDHPIEYLDFEGAIPEGQYGAGKVKIWDKGFFKLVKDSAKKPEKGNLIIDFSGKKIKDRYALIHMREKNWLFFKTKE